jgi:nitroreductase
MGKKKDKKDKKKGKRTPLEKKLRKLAKQGEHIEAAEAADAVVPAEVQLGGGDVLGSLAQVPSASADEPWRTQAGGPSVGTMSAVDSPSAAARPSVRYDLFDAIQRRRSHKRFLPTSVSRRELQVMFEAAVLAPNHKLTEPWGFVVMGDDTKRSYAGIRARTKVADDSAEAEEKRARIVEEVMDVPVIVAVTMHVDEDPVRREEDHAATFMAVQNLLLAGTALGLATKINTGRIMDREDLRELVGVGADERVVALINVGVPAESRGQPKRTPAADKTTWLP